jgi:hypothetical protein
VGIIDKFIVLSVSVSRCKGDNPNSYKHKQKYNSMIKLRMVKTSIGITLSHPLVGINLDFQSIDELTNFAVIHNRISAKDKFVVWLLEKKTLTLQIIGK